MQSGNRWVVDIDLEKFFDRVDHRLLMSRLAGTIKDRRVLRLIRHYLKSNNWIKSWSVVDTTSAATRTTAISM